MTQRLGIVSYSDKLRTLAHANHELYARAHGYTYIFDIAPTENWKYFAKLEKIAKFLPLFDWLFWIDDDAFFMQRHVPLTRFLEAVPEATVVFCESPVNEDKWTWLSSGNFFIRNTPLAAQFLQDVIATDREAVERWWDSSVYGHYTKGDQDAIVYQLVTNPLYSQPGFLVRLPFEAFNSRPTHFTESAKDQFLVHVTGGDKRGQAQRFGERFNLPESLTYWNELKALKGIYRPLDD